MRALTECFADHGLVGLGASGAAGDGAPAWAAAGGWASLERTEELQAHHRFPAYSITKLITSTAVLRLVAAGELSLDDPANRHLVLLGATGMGKTETVCNVLEWAAGQGWQTGYVTAKEPPDVTKSLAPRLAAIADRHGHQLRVLTAGLSPYDPMRGSLDEQRDRLIRIQARP